MYCLNTVATSGNTIRQNVWKTLQNIYSPQVPCNYNYTNWTKATRTFILGDISSSPIWKINCDIWSRKFYQEIVVDVIKNVRKEIDGAQWSDNLVVCISIKKNEFPGKKIFEKNWIKVTEKSTISAESFKRHLGILSSFLNVLLISCFSCCYVSQESRTKGTALQRPDFYPTSNLYHSKTTFLKSKAFQ